MRVATMQVPRPSRYFERGSLVYQFLEGIHVLSHTGAVLISKSHYFSKYWDSIHDILILQYDVDPLPEFMSLLLFIGVIVQAHVDKASNVCRCLQIHHLLGRCIYLVWSSISKLHQQPDIFDHQHVLKPNGILRKIEIIDFTYKRGDDTRCLRGNSN